MNEPFEIAPKIKTGLSLAAFAIAALTLLVIKLKGRKVPSIVWAVVAAIVVIALGPIIAPAYLNSYGIYRVRVVVLDEHNVPTNNAKVTCSVGGEVKKVDGGWECDIPAKTKPADGKMQAYARMDDAFLVGRAELELKDDYSPVATIQLAQDTSAAVLGIVTDESNLPIEGARVQVVGYDSEAITTKAGGGFSLAAHKAKGQQVQVFVFKEGYTTGPPEWHQAGNDSITLVLRKAAAKSKPT